MAVGVSRVTFTESNDARPTYIFAAISIALIAMDQVALRAFDSHSRSLYLAAIFTTMIAAICGMYCALGCIWHPIPEDRRVDGQLTTLHLSGTPQTDEGESPAPMFQSLDENFAADQEDSVDASQVELRDPIQWIKLLVVITSVGVNLTLMAVFTH